MKSVIIFLGLMIPVCLSGQQVERSAGVRLGLTSGVTYKKFINEIEIFELLLSPE